MLQYLVKLVLSSALIVAVSEIGKRSSFWAAALASLPLVSILAFVWLYVDTGSATRVAELSRGIFWLVLPSLVLFLALPALLRAGFGFWPGLATALVATAAAYFLMVWILEKAGIRL